MDQDSKQVQRSVVILWFNNTLSSGYERKLTLDDLPPLPASYYSEHVKREFQAATVIQPPSGLPSPRISVTNEWTHSEKWVTHLSSSEDKNKYGVKPLIYTILRCYGSSITKVGLIKLLTTALSFVGPVVLGYIVKILEDGVTQKNLGFGILLIVLLGGSSILSAILNTNYNIRTTIIKVNMQGALIRILFSRCLSLPLIAKKELFLTDSQVNNLIQVDIDQVCNCFKSIHDLWALPIQILIACILLYINIKTAFLAGITIIIIMIPINTIIAKQIGYATDHLMKAKDSRIRIITESFNNIISMKMTGLEEAVLKKSNILRKKELKYLTKRKYLDSICVFLWALTPVIVPFVTFITTIYMNITLTASDIITTIALLNMLIFPMNALPWVINGFMEARVSIRRIAKVLSSEDGEKLLVHNRFTRKTRHHVKFSDSILSEQPCRVSEDIHTNSIHKSGMYATTTTTAIGRGQRVSRNSRHSSGEAHRGDLSLSIPATVWSWATTQQLKHLLEITTSEHATHIDDDEGHTNPLLALPGAAEVTGSTGSRKGLNSNKDIENQLLHTPLLDAAHISDSLAKTETIDTSPFIVGINETQLKGGQVLGIVGATGSGKTSLLLGILGEIRGHKKLSDDGELYCI